MKRKASIWSVATVLCLVAALAAWVLNRADASFVLAALGALAWFLDLRRELNRANLEREASIVEAEEQESREVDFDAAGR